MDSVARSCSLGLLLLDMYVDEDWIIEGISLIYKTTYWKKPRRVALIRKTQVFEDG